jgi:putative transposase
MSTRDIEAHLRELYGVSVGRDLISRVTDAVMDDARAWQQRPLDDVYPVVFLDCMVLKIRDGGSVQRRACYLALGVGMDGERDVLGLWFQESEGAKFWMQVLSELRHRGEYDQVTKDLRPIYTAIDADHALQALEAFEQKWGAQLPPVDQAWRTSWEHVIPFLAFPPEVRRVIYTTNAIEALNRQVRKAVKTKGHFPTEDAARKLIYLAIQNAVPQWTNTRGWTKALLAFKIHFGDRLPD